MLKKLFNAILCLSLTASMTGEQHTLTDKKGREISVQLLKADDDHVWVKLANRKTAKIARDQLIESNQELIDEWKKNALPEIKVETKVARGNKRGGIEYIQNLQISVILENRDGHQGIDDIDVEVFLIGRGQWDKSYFTVLWDESQSVDLLADTTQTVTFSKLINTYADTWGFHAMNYVVHVTRGSDDKLIYLGSDDGVLDKRAEDVVKLEQGDVVKGNWTEKLDLPNRYRARIELAN